RLGRKRVFLACYGSRKVVMAGLLLLPWLIVHAGRNVGIAYLFGVIVVVGVLRALAETAYYPWTQEYIPNHVRGKFGGLGTVTCLVASIAAVCVAGRVLGGDGGMDRYRGLMAAGCVLGVLGVASMIRIPGGAPLAADSEPHMDNMAAALRDGNFVRYLAGMGLVTMGTGLIGIFLPLFVKEQLGVATGTVVTLDTAVMVGGAVASLILGPLMDRVGSRPVLMPSLFLCLLVPAGWLVLPRHGGNTVAWCAVLYFIQGAATIGVAIGAGRLLFNSVVPPSKSTAYTAIYYAWMGITAGVAPLAAGWLLAATSGHQTLLGGRPVDGYSLLFVLAVACLGLGWWQYGRVRPDDVHTTRTVLARAASRIWEWRP
ncbi:MAG: MFS transporter, partial [bacterium]